ncbi:hypothetical protein, partial [Maribacter dokdonensis]|uniref:hypothetical protein n=1 Tax=Maribacter dokdonensis TaxID=320912 RepID=UPI0027363D09
SLAGCKSTTYFPINKTFLQNKYKVFSCVTTTNLFTALYTQNKKAVLNLIKKSIHIIVDYIKILQAN